MSAALTVIGCSACAPTSLGPAPGYLVQHDGGAVLVDIGPGVVAGLAGAGLLDEVSAVVVSHEHADHSVDLTTLAYRRGFPERLPAMPLWAPTGFARRLAGLDAVYGIPTLPDLAAPLSDGFVLTAVEPGQGFAVEGLSITTIPAVHPVPTLSMRFDDLGLVYTADTGMSPELVELARGANVLLAEATYRDADGIDVSAHGHLTGSTAGELAARAGVARLVVTHLADPSHADDILAEAQAVFDGPVDLARPGLRVELG